MRRYEKRLLADGVAKRYVRITAPDEMATAVARYARLEGCGWKGAKGSALASSAAQMNFYVNAMSRFAASGQASVHELWFDDELAASRLVITRGQTHVMLKTTYAEKFASYALGRLLLRTVIEEKFARGPGGNIEFCTDAPPDLLGWATDQRWVQHASVYRSAIARHAISGVRILRKRGARLHLDAAKDRRLKAEKFSHPDCWPTDVQKFTNHSERTHIESGAASRYRNLADTAYAGDTRIFFYTLRRSGKVVAVLPLRAEKAVLGWYLHSLSDAHSTVYEPIFKPGLKPVELSFLITAIQRDFQGLASFKLALLDPHSSTYQTLLDSFQIIGCLPFELSGFGEFYETLSDVELTPSESNVGGGEINYEHKDIPRMNARVSQRRLQSEIIVHNSSSLRGMAKVAFESIRHLVRLRNASATREMHESDYLPRRDSALR